MLRNTVHSVKTRTRTDDILVLMFDCSSVQHNAHTMQLFNCNNSLGYHCRMCMLCMNSSSLKEVIGYLNSKLLFVKHHLQVLVYAMICVHKNHSKIAMFIRMHDSIQCCCLL